MTASLLSLALRNLLRNRRRSLATLLALAIGASAILIFGGYTTNLRYTLQTAYVRAGGHLQIQHRDFFHYGSGNPAAYGLARYEALIRALQADPELAAMTVAITPMLQFGGVAGNYDAGVSRTVIGTGYVPADVNRMRQWNEHGLRYERPPFPLDGAGPDAAVIGQGVARVLQLCEPLNVPPEACPRPTASRAGPATGPALGDDIAALAAAEAGARPGAAAGPAGTARIELLASQVRGAPNVAALTVVAAESQGFKELDEIALILPLQQAQKLVYGRSEPRVTSILVQLQRTAQMPAAQARIEAVLAQAAPGEPLAVLGFQALNPFYVQSQQMFDTIFGFIFALIGGIVLFTVGNTMNAAVIERTVEVGTLRAIGLRQQGIRRLFIAEGLVLGVVGALAGVAFAFAFATVFNAASLTWVPPGASEPLPLSIILQGRPGLVVGITVGLIAIAVASAWWPARRASGLKIVEALRHV